jgi:hypothetical protein
MSTTAVKNIDESEIHSQGEAKVIRLNPKFDYPDSLNSFGQTSNVDSTTSSLKLFSSDSYTDEDYTILALPKTLLQRPQASELASKVIRTQYSKELIANLRWLAENHEINDPLSIPYISDLLSLMKKYFDNFFHDPFSSFLLALYDGLTHNQAYLSLGKNVYENILRYIEALNNQDLDYKKIDSYIFKLEENGLNITPY